MHASACLDRLPTAQKSCCSIVPFNLFFLTQTAETKAASVLRQDQENEVRDRLGDEVDCESAPPLQEMENTPAPGTAIKLDL